MWTSRLQQNHLLNCVSFPNDISSLSLHTDLTSARLLFPPSCGTASPSRVEPFLSTQGWPHLSHSQTVRGEHIHLGGWAAQSSKPEKRLSLALYWHWSSFNIKGVAQFRTTQFGVCHSSKTAQYINSTSFPAQYSVDLNCRGSVSGPVTCWHEGTTTPPLV